MYGRLRGKALRWGSLRPPAVRKAFNLDLPQYGTGTSQVALYDNKDTDTDSDTSTTVTNSDEINVVYVTASGEEEAKRIARGLLEDKLAACINIIPKIVSVYEWEGKVVEDTEVLMMIKSPVKLLPQLTDKVYKLHSYDVAEVIATKVHGGSRKYIQWVQDISREE